MNTMRISHRIVNAVKAEMVKKALEKTPDNKYEWCGWNKVVSQQDELYANKM